MNWRALLLFVFVLCRPAHAQLLADFSGMAGISPGLYLMVSDAKNKSKAERVAVLRWSGGNYRLEPVAVDWNGAPSRDLEGCCSLPGDSAEFLLAESGYFKGDFGRVLQFRLTHDPQKGWTGKVMHSFQLPPPPRGEDSTASEQQLEGISAIPGPKGKPIVIIARRGGAKAPGMLEWGVVEDRRFLVQGTHEVDLRSILGDRSCADILLVPDGDGWRVFSVATADPGDVGAFASAVCEVGRFTAVGAYQPLAKPLLKARCDGLKIEALASAPPSFGPGKFCVGTDDEDYVPVWRVLP
ncbi:MAG: hypothetical protein FJX76_14370 [Armatimonadetes bacterium]|nr:hypothetical protein [Armatimonadota bacterium]